MRTVRALIALSAMSILAVSCGSSDGDTTGGSTTTAQQGASGGGGATTPAEGGGGGSAGEASNSVTYVITGDYETSGELPFIPEASAFSNGGWSASFSDTSNEKIVVMNTIPGSVIANYGDAQVAVPASEADSCTFDFTQNDSSGLSGSFECTGVETANSQTGAPITVDFSGQFDAHP
jgi:hypothetical protein